MFKYTIKRLFQSVGTVLIVATIVFLLMRMLPTDNFFTEDELMKYTEERKQEILEQKGILDPIPEQLMRFYGQLVRFDFGESARLQSGKPVVKIISDRMTVSMEMGMKAVCLSLVLGIILGIGQTLNKEGIIDHFGTVYTVFVNSVPALVSYSLVLVFGARVFDLPSLYSKRNPEMSSILPIVCLAMGSIAGQALWTRRYMVDELNKDYIKLAKIKGLSSGQIMVKHVFRNAFVPMAANIPASFLGTIGGSLLVEKFFSVPGMGPILTDAITRYDLNVVQALVIIYATLGIIGVFLGDILMMILDPRIRLTGKGEVR